VDLAFVIPDEFKVFIVTGRLDEKSNDIALSGIVEPAEFARLAAKNRPTILVFW
jgi:hypothetical protein